MSEQAKAAAVAGLLAPAVKSTQTAPRAVDDTVVGTLGTTVKMADPLLDVVDSALLEATAPILVGGVGKVVKSVDGTVRPTTDAVSGTAANAGSAAGTVVGSATGAAGSAVGGAVGGLGAAAGGSTGGLGGALGGLRPR